MSERDATIIERTVIERWTPVAGPVACLCGHEHYGRKSHSTQAPQWHICEDPNCECHSLQSTPATASERNADG